MSLRGDRVAEARAAWGQLQHEPAMEQYGLRGEGGPASPQNISLGSEHGVQLLAHREPCRFPRQRKQLDVKILKRSVQSSWPEPSAQPRAGSLCLQLCPQAGMTEPRARAVPHASQAAARPLAQAQIAGTSCLSVLALSVPHRLQYNRPVGLTALVGTS